jgi:hypothetical protein
MGSANPHQCPREETIIATDIDLGKKNFAVHSVNDAGKVELRQPKVARAKLNALFLLFGYRWTVAFCHRDSYTASTSDRASVI